MCSSCIIQKLNGFYTFRIENEREVRKNFLPIDVIFNPVVSDHKSINCYFSNQLNLTFRGNYSQRGKVHYRSMWQCY